MVTQRPERLRELEHGVQLRHGGKGVFLSVSENRDGIAVTLFKRDPKFSIHVGSGYEFRSTQRRQLRGSLPTLVKMSHPVFFPNWVLFFLVGAG